MIAETAAPAFRFYRLRFHFRAEDPVRFPPGKPGNVIRGAFGTILRRICCEPECPGARECTRRSACLYARIFEPQAPVGGPSGFADPPRPFVFRAGHLNGQTILTGTTFHFDVHIFDLALPSIPVYVAVFSELARSGLGPGRGRAKLTSVEGLDLEGQAAPAGEPAAGMSACPTLLTISLVAQRAAATRLRLEFVTPTELKHGQHLAARPDFDVLFARVRDRISNLTALYGAGPLGIDFQGLGERAGKISLVGCQIQPVSNERVSSRTGQRHPLGGFTGWAEYEGDLTEFLPFVEAATWAGVGRQTTFGSGEVRICDSGLPPPPRTPISTPICAVCKSGVLRKTNCEQDNCGLNCCVSEWFNYQADSAD